MTGHLIGYLTGQATARYDNASVYMNTKKLVHRFSFFIILNCLCWNDVSYCIVLSDVLSMIGKPVVWLKLRVELK